jgi:hypothetical protein
MRIDAQSRSESGGGARPTRLGLSWELEELSLARQLIASLALALAIGVVILLLLGAG